MPFMNYSGVIVQGRSPLSFVLEGISWAAVVIVRGEKDWGIIVLGEISQSAIVRGLSSRGKLFRVLVRGTKVWKVIVLGGISGGQLFRGNMSGYPKDISN